MEDELKRFDDINTLAAQWLLCYTKDKSQIKVTGLNLKDDRHLWFLHMCKVCENIRSGQKLFYLDLSCFKRWYLQFFEHLKFSRSRASCSILIEVPKFLEEFCYMEGVDPQEISKIYSAYYRS